MANKTRIEFDGFEEVIARLSKLDGDIKKTTEKALIETHKIITKKAEEAIRPHKRTGKTEKSLVRQAKVDWNGTIASVETGFDIANGGLPTIFLMYGTPRHIGANQFGKHGKTINGINQDKKLYNAFFGKKTKDEIKKIQEDIFFEEIRRLNG